MRLNRVVMPSMILLLIIMMINEVFAATEGYKCIDAQGQITYTELAIRGAECTSLGKAPKTSTDPEAAIQKLRDQVKAIDETKEQEKDKGNETAAEKRKKNCELSQKNQEILEGPGEIVTTAADGAKKILSAEERAASLAKTKKDIDYWCSE